MSKRIDLTGRVFGRLTVICYEGTNKRGQSVWRCKCECGSEISALGYNLTVGHTHSCGCLAREINASRKTTHGMFGTRIYRIWHHMIERCENPSSAYYSRYGGRGIRVCEKWHTFDGFYADMGTGYRDDLTIDRINNDGNYEPANCRWTDWKTQQRNRTGLRLYNGSCVTENCERLGISASTVYGRISRGWTLKAALTTPVRKRKRKGDKCEKSE